MTCVGVALALGVFLVVFWIRGERKRVRMLERKSIENDQLRIQLDRLRTAAEIDVHIDSLTDDQLRERLRHSPHRRD